MLAESLLSAVAGKLVSDLGNQVKHNLTQSDIQKAIKSGLSAAEKEENKLVAPEQIFYKCQPKLVRDFLGKFFKHNRVQQELYKPLCNQGHPDLETLAITFEHVGKEFAIKLNSDRVRDWLKAFVNAYGHQSGAYLKFQAAKGRYFQQLINYFDDIKFAGIDVPGEEVEKSERLAQIFVMPDVQEERELVGEREWLQSEDPETVETQSKEYRSQEISKFNAQELLTQGMNSRTPRTVLLGVPGSGKTTLLSYFAVMAASGNLEKLGLSQEIDWLPILVPIRNWASKLDLGLLDYLRDFAKQSLVVQDLPEGFFEHWLEDNRVLILLDGLDEVADEGKRSQIVQQIETFLGRYSKNPTIITSRPSGYRRDFFRTEEFPHYQLQPFDENKIKLFVKHWYDSRTKDKEESKRRQESLHQALNENDRIKLLAGNPLLLTIIALIHRYHAYLPRERYKLYDKAVDTLLTSWDQQKELTSHENLHYLGLDDLRRILESMAYWIHDQGSASNEQSGTLVARDELQQWLSQEIKELKQVELYQAKEEAERFLDFVRERTGLLNEQGQDYYAFVHKTFQEYLCAQEINYEHEDEGEFQIVLEAIQKHLHDPHWREVLLLLIVQQKRKKAAKAIRAVLNNESKYEEWLHRDLFFAAACLAEDPNNLTSADNSLPKEIIEKLVKLEVTNSNQVGRRIKEQVFHCLRRLAETAFEGQALQILKDYTPQISKDRLRSYRAELGDWDGVVQETVEELSNEDSEMRASAARALGRLGDASELVLEALQKRLEDENSEVRANAIRTIGELGNASNSLVKALQKRLEDENSKVRARASIALGELGEASESVVKALQQRLEDENSEVRFSAIRALGELGEASESVVKALQQRLEDEDFEVRFSAIRALGELGEASESVVKALQKRLEDENSEVRASAIRALGELGEASESVVKALQKRLEDEDSEVRTTATRALVRQGQASDSLVEALQQPLEDEDRKVRFYANTILMLLVKQGLTSDSLVEALQKRLEDKNLPVQLQASFTLAELIQTSSSILPKLIEWLEHHRNSQYLGNGIDTLWMAVVGDTDS